MILTREAVLAMNNSELKLAVAKSKDWSIIQLDGTDYFLKQNVQTGNWVRVLIPDYPNDIAAAYELEVSVPEGKRLDYSVELATIVGGIWWDLIHATPDQRTRAYLLAMESEEK